MNEPRCIWLALEGPEIIEMKQVVLDRDMAGAATSWRTPHLRLPPHAGACRPGYVALSAHVVLTDQSLS